MNPEIIFYALLPILIFESAFFTDVHIFLREMWQVMLVLFPLFSSFFMRLLSCHVFMPLDFVIYVYYYFSWGLGNSELLPYSLFHARKMTGIVFYSLFFHCWS